MNEELISQIVRRILSDPAFSALLASEKEETPPKDEILVLLNYAPEMTKQLAKLQELWGDKFSFKVLGSNAVMAEKPQLPCGMEWANAEEAWKKDNFVKILLPTCSANTLAKIALGLRDTLICELVAKGITQGIPVQIAIDLGFTQKTPAAYKKLYEGYVEQVKSYGITVSESVDKLCLECGSPACKEAPCVEAGSGASSVYGGQEPAVKKERPQEETITWTKKLLTENDAAKLPRNSTLKLAKNTIISPLAKDKLLDRRIQVFRDGEVCY